MRFGLMVMPGCGGSGDVEQSLGLSPAPIFTLASTITLASNRHVAPPPSTAIEHLLAAEIYLMDPDGSNPQRLTDNSDFDAFAKLSPDGKKLVFDRAPLQAPCVTSSAPQGAGVCVNVSSLFLMSTDGTEQALLAHGASASWSPDGKSVAFHASASGTGLPRRTDPGSATEDSDLFVLNVDDALLGKVAPRNLTNSDGWIDDDPDWSPDGSRILFTRHAVSDHPVRSNSAEIFAIDPDGDGLLRLTDNTYEERGPAWSPDGTRIAYMCRIDGGASDFEICVMNADGSAQVQVTDNSTLDATPAWSPDGQNAFVIHRVVAGLFQLVRLDLDGPLPTPGEQLTTGATANGFPGWGERRIRVTD